MTVRKIEIERFSVTSSKPYAAVVAAIKANLPMRAKPRVFLVRDLYIQPSITER